MAYELTIKKNATFANPELERLTEEMSATITAVGKAASNAKIFCAKTLSDIKEKGLFKDDGFEKAEHFCMEVMGMSASNASAYMQVGKKLNNNELPLTDSEGNKYNFTQLRALAKVKNAEALTDGTFNASMSTDAIDEKIAEVNPASKPRKSTEKSYLWEIVGEGEETEGMTKTQLIGGMVDRGITFIGELKNENDLYIVAIDAGGFPMMWKRSSEVKKVVEAGE